MFRLAKKEAAKSTVRAQHGAVLCRGSRVLSVGHNQKKCHPSWGTGPWLWMHAEGAAIRAAVNKGIDITRCTLYVVRVKDGVLVNSKPCPGCQKLIAKYQLKARWSE